MTTLSGKAPKNTFKDLLQVSNGNAGVDGTLRNVEDGEGTASALQLSTTLVNINGTFQVQGATWAIGTNIQGYDAATAKTNVAQTFTRQQNTGAVALTDAATIAWDLNAAQVARVTLGGSRTLANPTNMVAGGTYSLMVSQDGSGARTLNFGSAYRWPEDTPPDLSTLPNHMNLLTFYSDGTYMYGGLAGRAYTQP